MMPANGWRLRQGGTLHAEIDEFEEVVAGRIEIEEEIAMLEALLVYTGNAIRAEVKADLDKSLEVAREKLQSLK